MAELKTIPFESYESCKSNVAVVQHTIYCVSYTRFTHKDNTKNQCYDSSRPVLLEFLV